MPVGIVLLGRTLPCLVPLSYLRLPLSHPRPLQSCFGDPLSLLVSPWDVTCATLFKYSRELFVSRVDMLLAYVWILGHSLLPLLSVVYPTNTVEDVTAKPLYHPTDTETTKKGPDYVYNTREMLDRLTTQYQQWTRRPQAMLPSDARDEHDGSEQASAGKILQGIPITQSKTEPAPSGHAKLPDGRKDTHTRTCQRATNNRADRGERRAMSCVYLLSE